ncbi:MAG TPA: TIGR02147 family protein [Fibrobacteria bacterium]|nr:TIGR02147 family protein [Fibrobacteria bacterium]HOX52938.1 TIGR02147 family protein [Fibrobacteria bacterium]
MQSVFEYLDYREYLRDFHEKRKQEVPHCTYRTLADFFGMDTANLFRILKGKAHLPVRSHSRAIDYLGLSGKAAEFFLLLISHSRERHAGMRSDLLEKAMVLRDSVLGSDRPCGEEGGHVTESVESVSRIRRDVSILTFAGDQETLADIQDILLECRNRIQRRIERTDSPDRVLRLEMSIVPVSRSVSLPADMDSPEHRLSPLAAQAT